LRFSKTALFFVDQILRITVSIFVEQSFLSG